MISSVLSLLSIAALGMPLMAILSEANRFRRRPRYIVLAVCHVAFAANAIWFRIAVAGAWFAQNQNSGTTTVLFYVAVNCVLVTSAVTVFLGTVTGGVPYYKSFLLRHILLLLGIVAAFAIVDGFPQYLPSVLGVMLLVVCSHNGYALFKSLEDDFYIPTGILTFWMLDTFGLAFGNQSVHMLFHFLFAASVAGYVARQVFSVNRDERDRRELLVRSRDIALSMLTKISSSVKNISSIEYTLGQILQTILPTLSAESAAVYLLDNKELRFAKSEGRFWPMSTEVDLVFTRQAYMEEHLHKTSFPLGKGIVGMAAETARPVSVDGRDVLRMRNLGLNTRNIRSVLAVPLRVKERMLGVLVTQNRQGQDSFDNNDLHLLEALADQAAISMNNAHLYAELARTERIRQEMDIAAQIQRQNLPKSVPTTPNLRISAFMEPAKEVGGDYYDFVENKDGNLGIAIGDVSGKGLPAGMIMMIARTVLRIVARGHEDVRDIVLRFSDEMFRRLRSEQFMTFNFLRWNCESRTLSYASAGHEYILWYHASSGRSERIRAGGVAVGLVKNAKDYIEKHELATEVGDLIVLYTDGVTEAQNPNGEFYSLDRLQNMLDQNASIADPEQIKERIIGDVNRFIDGADQYDDITMLVLSVT